MFFGLFKSRQPAQNIKNNENKKADSPSPYDSMTIEELKKEVVKTQHPSVFGYLDQSHVPRLTKKLLIGALMNKNKKINPKCKYIIQTVYGMRGPVICSKK